MKIFKPLLVTSFLSNLLSAQNPVEKISVDAFCDQFKGTYKIEAVNGGKPKPETETAAIEWDSQTKECIFSFPFCLPNGTCDPGYHFFTNQNTSITGANNKDYSLTLDTNGKKSNYRWQLEGGNFKFTNPQLKLEFAGKKPL